MNFLNLTIFEFLGLLLPLGIAVAALYFYDRSRRRYTVSTLRFWSNDPDLPMVTIRKKLQQPISLLLQLLSILVLLLAIADVRWAGRVSVTPRHVIILDCSAWMGASGPDSQILMDHVIDLTQSYLAATPILEPIMLIRGDANPAPVTPFTTDREVLKKALWDLKPSWNAIDLATAFEVAHTALSLYVTPGGDLSEDPEIGEITYIGSGFTAMPNKIPYEFSRVRWIDVGDRVDDGGIEKLVARRLSEMSGIWEVQATVFHIGEREQTMTAKVLFEKKLLRSIVLTVASNEVQELNFKLHTERAGRVEVLLTPSDRFSLNNSVSLELPGYNRHRVDVYSPKEKQLKNLLGANFGLNVKFHSRKNYFESEAKAIVFQEFSPVTPPQSNLIYIRPPHNNSPVAVVRTAHEQRISWWNSNHPVARGLRTQDVVLSETLVFNPLPSDEIIAKCEAGPVIISRVRKGYKQVFFGFNFSNTALVNKLATPLLFANTMAWIFPDTYRSSELRAQSPGLIEMEIGDVIEDDITVSSTKEKNLPWRYNSGKLRLFASLPGSVTVHTPTTETHLNLFLPEVLRKRWRPDTDILRGVPSSKDESEVNSILWPLLTLLAAFFWIVEWFFFGRTVSGTVL